jgi:hypothetical protein
MGLSSINRVIGSLEAGTYPDQVQAMVEAALQNPSLFTDLAFSQTMDSVLALLRLALNEARAETSKVFAVNDLDATIQNITSTMGESVKRKESGFSMDREPMSAEERARRQARLDQQLDRMRDSLDHLMKELRDVQLAATQKTGLQDTRF